MSVSPSGKVAPPPAKKVVSVAPTHPVAKAIVAAVHKAVTPIAKKLNLPVRPYGMHPLAFALYVKSGLPVSRIGQTIGNAKASAGTHCKTGEYQGHDYGACFDLHVTDLTHAECIAKIVRPLAAVGLASYMRVPGQDHWPASEAYHAHNVYPGGNMTQEVEHQVKDWLNVPTLNGLASHVAYTSYQATHDERLACLALFATHKVV